MQQEDELDFDEDELVPQPALVPSSSHSSISSSQPPPTDSSAVPAPTSNVPSSSTTATDHDPTVDVTGKKLPAGWISRISNSTGETYYRNTVNNTSSWEIPTSSAVPPEEESAAPAAQAPPVQASVEHRANPQTQAQQGAATADAAEERTEKPLPTGPRSQTRTPQSAAASPVLPTGPRASRQNGSTVVAASAKPNSRDYASRGTSDVQPNSVSSSRSHDSLKSSTSASNPSPVSELPKGPRASLDQHQQQRPQQSNSTAPLASSSSTNPPRSSAQSTPTTSAPSLLPTGPRSNRVPAPYENPKVPSTSSSSRATASTSTSRSVDVDNTKSSNSSSSKSKDVDPAALPRGPAADAIIRTRSLARDEPPAPLSIPTAPKASSSALPPISSYRNPRRVAGHLSRVRKYVLQPATTTRTTENEVSITNELSKNGKDVEMQDREKERERSRSRSKSVSKPSREERSPIRMKDRSRSPVTRRKEEALDRKSVKREEEDLSTRRRREEEEERESQRRKLNGHHRTERGSEARATEDGRGDDKNIVGSSSSRREKERSPVDDRKRRDVRQESPQSSRKRERSRSRERENQRERERELEKERERERVKREQQELEKREEARRREDRNRRPEDFDSRRRYEEPRERSIRDERPPPTKTDYRRMEIDSPAPRSAPPHLPRRSSLSRQVSPKRSFRDERERERPREMRYDSRVIRDDRERDRRDEYRGRDRELERPRRDHRDDERSIPRERREPSPPLLRFASSNTTFVPPPTLPALPSRPSHRSRPRSRSRSPPPPAPIYLRIGGGSIDNIVGPSPTSAGGGPGERVPLIRIVGGSTDSFGLRGSTRGSIDQSPPLSSRSSRGGDNGRTRNRSPPPSSASRDSFSKSANSALPPRPHGSPTQSSSLLSRVNGLPVRPLSLNGDSRSTGERGGGGATPAKRIRDPEQVIREAEMKKRRGS